MKEKVIICERDEWKGQTQHWGREERRNPKALLINIPSKKRKEGSRVLGGRESSLLPLPKGEGGLHRERADRRVKKGSYSETGGSIQIPDLVKKGKTD